MVLRRRSGFSLVEMIGVLAIIAILAVIIVPKVFATIQSSRVTSTVASVNSMKTAITDFAGKYGTIPTTNANSRIDDLLLQVGILDSRFNVKLGTQPSAASPVAATWAATSPWALTSAGTSQATQSRIICVTSAPAAVPGTAGTNYHLDGVATTNMPTGAQVVSAVIVGVTPAEARELSLKIDGDQLTPATTGVADTAGKVTYTAAGTTVYIYLTHQ